MLHEVGERAELVVIRVHREGARVPIGTAWKSNASFTGVLNEFPPADGVTENAKEALEPLAVGVLSGEPLVQRRGPFGAPDRQHTAEDRGPTGC
jgi:hypothetical protein